MDLRRLLPAPIVVIALSWVAASSAYAAAEFEAGEYPATLSGAASGEHTFALESEINVKCKKATLTGQLAEPSESLVVTPAYSECTGPGGSATVEAKNCSYVLMPSEEVKEKQFNSTTSIECTGGKTLTITLAGKGCEAQIGTQSGLSNITYIDNLEASPANITLEFNLSKIKYTVTKDEESCPFSKTGEKTGGALTGKSSLEGAIEGEAVGVAVAPAGKTKLCKEAPGAGAKCPAGKAFASGTQVAALSKPPAQQGVSVFLVEGKTIEEIACEESTFSMRTKEQEGRPLKVESVFVAFAVCKTAAKGTSCNVQMTPENGKVYASGLLAPGVGKVLAPMTLFIECGAEYKCQYSVASQEFQIKGSATPTMFTGLPRPRYVKETIAGEVGCTTRADWFGKYTVTEPKELWVTH